MAKTIAVSFDIADQVVKRYDAIEWHNFVADHREYLSDEWGPSDQTLEELFEEYYGEEFFFEVLDENKKFPYAVAFDLERAEFIICADDNEVDFIMTMAEENDYAEEIVWCE